MTGVQTCALPILLWSRAEERGVSRLTFDAAFAGVSFDPKVVAMTQAQPEFVRPIWDYVASAASADRVARGRGKATGMSARMRPGSLLKIKMRSATSTASSILCETMTIPLVGMRLASHKSRRSPRKVSAVSTSREENGSSRSRMSGLTTRAQIGRAHV